MSFGNELSEYQKGWISSMKVALPEKFSPMDGGEFVVVGAEHAVFHHYMKVVATHYRIGRKAMAYQILSTNQVMVYAEEDVPEAKFIYDISPMAVVVEENGRYFYEFITSLLAILGGTFTVVSLLENTLYLAMKPKAD